MGFSIRNWVSRIGQFVSGGTTGSVLYVDNNGSLGQDNSNLFYDATNKRLGVGTNAPSNSISTTGPISTDSGGIFGNETRTYGINLGTANVVDIRTNNSDTRLVIDSTGNVIINGATATTNCVLDIQSTGRAFAPPRMTTVQKAAIGTPSAGMVVYDTTLNKLSVYTGATWETVTSA